LVFQVQTRARWHLYAILRLSSNKTALNERADQADFAAAYYGCFIEFGLQNLTITDQQNITNRLDRNNFILNNNNI